MAAASQPVLIQLAKGFEFIVNSRKFTKMDVQNLNLSIQANGPPISLAQIRFRAFNLPVAGVPDELNEVIKEYQERKVHELFLNFVTISIKRHYSTEVGDEGTRRKYCVGINRNFLRSLRGICSDIDISLCEMAEERRLGNWRDWGNGHTCLENKFELISNVKGSLNDEDVVNFEFLPSCLEAEELILKGKSDIRLRFQLTVTVLLDPRITAGDRKLPVLKLKEESILQELFGSQTTKDITIIAGNGAEIKCHRNLLAVHSPVLDVMTSSNMKEGETGVIRLEDMSEEGVNHLVRYLYGMEIPAQELESDTVLDLFQAAHKYKLSKLEEALAYIFLLKDEKWLGVDDALELYYYTLNMEEYGDLQKHLSQIIKKIPSKDLRESVKFNKLKPADALELTLKLMET